MSPVTVTVTVDFPTGPETRHLRADSGIAEGSLLTLDEYRRVRGLESVRNQRDRDRPAPRDPGADPVVEIGELLVLIVGVALIAGGYIVWKLLAGGQP